jgi:tryptophanyl-tRNA synthetase
MGLDDPIKKMSKSSQNKNHAIYLLDSPEIIRDKIAKATTDSKKDIRFDKKRPGIYNLLNIYELFTNKKRKEIETKYEGKGYADFKEDLAEIIIKGLKPVQDRYKELTSDPNRIDSLLDEGANRIEPLADKLLSKVKKKVGLV